MLLGEIDKEDIEMAKYLFNQEAVENLRLGDLSVLSRLVDFESAREAHLKKEHAKKDKRMSLAQAVATYVQDGDIITDSGFSYVRTPHQAFHEVIRQGKESSDDRGAQYQSELLYLVRLRNLFPQFIQRRGDARD